MNYELSMSILRSQKVPHIGVVLGNNLHLVALVQSLHTGFHHTVIDGDATDDNGHPLGIHAAELDGVTLHDVALLDYPHVRLTVVLENGMGRNRQTTDSFIATYFYIYIHVDARTEMAAVQYASEELTNWR